MQPLSRLYMHSNGNDYERIGDNRRNTEIPDHSALERLLEERCPLSINLETTSTAPPYFHEFAYGELFGGLKIYCGSAEVTARLSMQCIEHEPLHRLDIDAVIDKYELQQARHPARRVVFLPGSNLTNIIDQPALQRLMRDERWYIKPHPITTDEMLHDLAYVYGYHRIIERDVSGIGLLRQSHAIATTSASELYLIARMLDIPVADITRFDTGWLTSYHHIIRLFDGTDHDREVIDRVLYSPIGGYVHPDFATARNQQMADAYFEAAMAERERWGMVTNQMLKVGDHSILRWK